LKLSVLLLGVVLPGALVAQDVVTLETRPGVPVSPCEPLSQHGFFAKEAETVDAIAAWMLGRPFEKEIR
jgi:hypothetical protein